MTDRPHVVIVGGGFAGIAAARGLRDAPVRITLLDRANHHLFQPLLYQVATAGLAPSDIAEPIRSILRSQENVVVRLAEVRAIDAAAKTVRVVPESGVEEDLRYDTLVVAAGASHSYFGHDEWERDAPGLKTLGDALEIRRRVLSAFERAEWEPDPAERAALTTFVVIGGGPTGVELAGSLAEISCWTLRRDFRNIDPTRARIVLLEGADSLLGAYHPTLRDKARAQLESLGVTVRLGAKVTGVDAGGVTIGDERLPARTVLWAAGVRGAPLARSLGAPLDRAGRVEVAPDCSVPAHPEIFVIGDLASFTHTADGKPVPGVAPAAKQMGEFVAAAIRADLAGAPRGRFVYGDKGSMATIGRSRAILEAGRLRLAGPLAWLLWVAVHVLFLVTFRNRLLVMTKWAWAWLRYERASRLIWKPSTAARPE